MWNGIAGRYPGNVAWKSLPTLQDAIRSENSEALVERIAATALAAEADVVSGEEAEACASRIRRVIEDVLDLSVGPFQEWCLLPALRLPAGGVIGCAAEPRHVRQCREGRRDFRLCI